MPGNAAATLVARAFTTLAQVAVFAVIAREYGAKALDSYAVALSIATFAALVLDYGMSVWATREVARGNQISPQLRARLPLGFLILLAAAGCAIAGVVAAGEAAVICVLAIAMAASLLARGVFWGRRLHDRETAFAALESWGVVALLLAAHFGAAPRTNALVWTAIAYTAGAIGRWLTMPREARPSGPGNPTSVWMRELTPFGIQNMVTTASAQLDVVLLSLLITHPQPGTVAAYALALRVYYASPMPLEALGAALLPRFVEDAPAYRRGAVIGTLVGTSLAVTGAVAFALLAPVLGYGDTIVHLMRTVLVILSLAFLARCSAYVLSAYVIAQGAQMTRLAASVAALGTMVALDVTLIPLIGAYGAAWAMVAADWVLLVGYLLGTRATATRARARLAPHGL
ncbi:MAG: oligosaccharide flippase family protein [Solirubrobacteraceae bacterium]